MSGLTPFQPGNNANPSGKSSAQRLMEIANAEKATKLRGMMLDALLAKVEAAVVGKPEEGVEGYPQAAADQIGADVLRLLKDSEDRGLGAPKQPLVGDPDNPLVVTRIVIEAATNDDGADQAAS